MPSSRGLRPILVTKDPAIDGSPFSETRMPPATIWKVANMDRKIQPSSPGLPCQYTHVMRRGVSMRYSTRDAAASDAVGSRAIETDRKGRGLHEQQSREN